MQKQHNFAWAGVTGVLGKKKQTKHPLLQRNHPKHRTPMVNKLVIFILGFFLVKICRYTCA